MSRASEGPARSVALIAPLAVIAGLIAAVLCYHPEPARPVVALTVASGKDAGVAGSGAPPCGNDDLAAVAESQDQAMGDAIAYLRVMNTTDGACSVPSGPPELTVVRGDEDQHLRVVPGNRQTGVSSVPDGETIVLAPFRSVTAAVEWKAGQQADAEEKTSITLAFGEVSALPVHVGANAAADGLLATDPGMDVIVSGFSQAALGPLRGGDASGAAEDVDPALDEPCMLAKDDSDDKDDAGGAPADATLTLRNVGLHPCIPPALVTLDEAGSGGTVDDGSLLSTASVYGRYHALAVGGRVSYRAASKDRPNWFLRHYGSWRPESVARLSIVE